MIEKRKSEVRIEKTRMKKCLRRRARKMINRALNKFCPASPELGAMHCVRETVSDVFAAC